MAKKKRLDKEKILSFWGEPAEIVKSHGEFESNPLKFEKKTETVLPTNSVFYD